MSYAEDYKKYRGKCKEFCEALIIERPELTMVRGYYYEPNWNREEAHWWCVDSIGTIIDPTRKQFPSGGIACFYRPYDGFSDCAECGKSIPEAEIIFNGRYPCCSEHCALALVGLA